MADPAPPTDFSALRLLTAEQLVQLGCMRWDEQLVLFPASWADAIPEGFEVRTIHGTTEPFSKNWPRTRFDRRLGMLAFGIPACPKEFAPTVSDGYPADWPRCKADCGLPALDGHATCGSVGCNEAAYR